MKTPIQLSAVATAIAAFSVSFAVSLATLSAQLAPTVPSPAFNLTGFGQTTTGGGVIAETDSAYRKVTTPAEFMQAINDASTVAGKVRVIEIMNDLDLGYIEVTTAVTGSFSQIRRASTPLLHPRLIATGVSVIDISIKGPGITIFSASGAAIRHCKLNIINCSNIIIRNLRFDELWEWDEDTKGEYGRNDWDFIALGDGNGAVTNVWIDHCTFTKAYDGGIDVKAPAHSITVSWCRFPGDDSASPEGPAAWVRAQLEALETTRQTNPSAIPFYDFLRTNKFSQEQILQTIKGHDKTSLLGTTTLQLENKDLSATCHHIAFTNTWDRCVPRLRAGNAHVYNITSDSTDTLVAKRIRDAINGTYDAATKAVFNTYNFNPSINGCISTEGGALLVEKSVFTNIRAVLRNNQTDPNDPVYTGKIEGRDIIYHMDDITASGTTAIIGARATTRGNSTDPDSPLGPVQAAPLPFSWNTNTTAPAGELPYAIDHMDDPAQLPAILDAGAGAGVIIWDAPDGKLNWLKTTYHIPPNISWAPGAGSQIVQEGATPTFTATITSGTPPFTCRWSRDTTLLVTSTTSATTISYTMPPVAHGDSGTCTLQVANPTGTATLAATLTITPGPARLAAQRFKDQAEAAGAATITVTGTLDLALVDGICGVWIASGKTIIGADSTATILGGLNTAGNDIALIGLNLTGHGMTINGSRNLDILHCTFTDAPVTITGAATSIAFSWNKFTATPATPAFPAAPASASAMILYGSAICIILDHNHWTGALRTDMPRVSSHARAHIYNNYFTATGNTTTTIADNGAQVLSANNIYQGVNNPLSTENGGLLRALGNFVNETCTGASASGNDIIFVPAYSHIMHSAGNDTPGAVELAALITAHAGNTDGKNSVTPEVAGASVLITATNLAPGSSTTATAVNVPAGSALALTANATGFTPATRQWYRDNFAIPGATSSIHIITNATASTHGGAYAVALTATGGEIITSPAFTLAIMQTSGTTPGGNNSGGGGGGGGGASSRLYLLTAGALLAYRVKGKGH